MVSHFGEMVPFGVFSLLFGAYIIFVIVIYVYLALALMTIAKKTNTPHAWFAWIPIANLYLMTQIAGLPGWHTALFLLTFIPVIGAIAFAGIMIWCYRIWIKTFSIFGMLNNHVT